MDYDAACAEGRLLKGGAGDADGDVRLSLEILLEEAGGVVGGRGGGSGGAELVDLRLVLSGALLQRWFGAAPSRRAALEEEQQRREQREEPEHDWTTGKVRNADEAPAWEMDDNTRKESGWSNDWN